MFTGIITDIGRVRAIEGGTDARIEIATAYDVDDIALGASIACSGPCMTVIETGRDDGGPGWFAVQASPETLARTTIGEWRAGRAVNLERALRIGDELGGHMVSGHIDGIARVAAREPVGDGEGSVRFRIEAPGELARFLSPKGSVVLDGVSLTVNEVDGATFTVNIIPHTLTHTTFGETEPGARLNIEADMIARYVARLMEGEALR